MGEGGSVDDGTVSEVAEGMRSLLAAIDARQMSCSAAYRNRLQGAVVALESLVRGDLDGRDRTTGVHRADVDAQQLAHPTGDALRGTQGVGGHHYGVAGGRFVLVGHPPE